MEGIDLADIVFDAEDANLFSYKDDLLLKARAVQNVILPKLNALLVKSINNVESIYGISVYDENSHHVFWPHFRENRENDLKKDYPEAGSGISGKRLPVWKKLSRDDKKPVKIIPMHLQYEFSENGLLICFYIDSRIDLSLESFRMLFNELYENVEDIQTFALAYGFKIEAGYLNDQFLPLKKRLKKIINCDDKAYYRFCCIKEYKLPFNAEVNSQVLDDFASLFPIYYDLLLLSQGKQPMFKELSRKFKKHYFDSLLETNTPKKTSRSSKGTISKKIKAFAEKAVDASGIRAGIRWQVFARDNFKCVACGASQKDGAILHVDHIIPRSKGGTDTMENYQTLCQKCNIGKSNKSCLDLRANKK